MRKLLIYTASGAALFFGTQTLKAAQDKSPAEKGKDVFEACAGCHNADSTEKKMGPGLKGLFARDKLANGKKITDESVTEQINEGGNGMPGYKDILSDDERKNLLAYLKTL